MVNIFMKRFITLKLVSNNLKYRPASLKFQKLQSRNRVIRKCAVFAWAEFRFINAISNFLIGCISSCNLRKCNPKHSSNREVLQHVQRLEWLNHAGIPKKTLTYFQTFEGSLLLCVNYPLKIVEVFFYNMKRSGDFQSFQQIDLFLRDCS